MSIKLTWVDYPEIWDNQPIPKLDFSPKNFQNTLFIGDNYPILRGLSEIGFTVDLIYIDPPYNTGNNFIYKDDFSSRFKNGSVDLHSAWLSFMERRLSLAKKLLSEKGVIFIAIDQSELYTLKLLCDQIFGEENFINDFMWLHGKGKKDSWSRTLQQHTLCYARNKKELKPFREVEFSSWATKNVDNDPRGYWFSGSISFSEARSNPKHKNFYEITSPSGKIWKRQWQVTKEEMEVLLKENKIFWGSAPAYDKVPRKKVFNETPTEVIPRNIIDMVSSTRSAQAHLDSLIGKKSSFDNPKPVDLIEHLIGITQLQSDAIILDFFAGSGTTFEAVCNLNKKDNGKRRCILVQKDENGIAKLCELRCKKVGEIKVLSLPSCSS